MSNAADNPSHANPPPGPTHVEPTPDAAPKTIADELFAHGLLTYLHTDTPARQGERIGRLMSTLESDRDMGVLPMPSARSFRFPVRTARAWVALAACITLAAVATLVGLPSESSAKADVLQAISAMRAGNAGGGDRRFEIRLQLRNQNAIPSLPGAIVDTRSPNLLLLRANGPDGHEIIAGRDASGDWAIRPDAGVEREHPQAAWPRWANVGDESLFVDSVDRLLEELTKSYDLQREGAAKLEGKGEASFRHIVGAKKRLRSPGGDRVELWIDPATNVVERLEMRWDQPTPLDGPGADRARDPRDGPGIGGPRDDAPDDRPHGRPPRDGAFDDGPPPGGFRDRPFPPPGRPGPNGPDGPGDPDGQDRPDGPNGPDDGPPPRDGRHPGVPGMGGNGPMRGMDGLGGPRPDGRPPRAPFGPGPRGPGPNARLGPPKALVMQRVDAPSFDPSWFTPEGHATK
jgi:hypothetical protein